MMGRGVGSRRGFRGGGRGDGGGRDGGGGRGVVRCWGEGLEQAFFVGFGSWSLAGCAARPRWMVSVLEHWLCAQPWADCIGTLPVMSGHAGEGALGKGEGTKGVRGLSSKRSCHRDMMEEEDGCQSKGEEQF